jgi:ribosomal protein L31
LLASLLREVKIHHPDEQDISEEKLFNTPIRPTFIHHSPAPNIHPFYTGSHRKQKRSSMHDENEEE